MYRIATLKIMDKPESSRTGIIYISFADAYAGLQAIGKSVSSQETGLDFLKLEASSFASRCTTLKLRNL